MKTRSISLVVSMAIACTCQAQGVITAFAGTGSIGLSGDGGSATNAAIGFPAGVAVDAGGNVYIADSVHSVIRKVNTTGTISTFAGNGIPLFTGDGGQASKAGLSFGPSAHVGMVFDSKGNLYFTDIQHSRIRKIDPSGVITTVAGNNTSPGLGVFSGDGGQATAAAMNSPRGVAVDSQGNIYIADTGNGRIRKVDTTGIITTIAGTKLGSDTGDGGPALGAQLSTVSDIAVDPSGNLYLADEEHIREINPSGSINTVIHDLSGRCGLTPIPAANADAGMATGLTTDSSGNLYIADSSGSCVHELGTNGMVSTLAGGGGTFHGTGIPATSAALGNLYAVALDSARNLYIADSSGWIWKVSAGSITPPVPPAISANGVVNGASFASGIGANAWVTISGSNFSTAPASWTITGGVLPTMLQGVSVTIGGAPAFVNYVSPGQINVLTPPALPAGMQPVIVTTSGGASPAVTVSAAEYAPAFFTWPGNQAVATHQDFSWAVKNGTFAGVTTVAAKPGDVIILWGTGFGPTIPAVPPGIVVPSTLTYKTSVLPTVTVNGMAATVYGAALAPGYGGLYQIAFQVPASLADGDYAVSATIMGSASAAGPVLSVKK